MKTGISKTELNLITFALSHLKSNIELNPNIGDDITEILETNLDDPKDWSVACQQLIDALLQ